MLVLFLYCCTDLSVGRHCVHLDAFYHQYLCIFLKISTEEKKCTRVMSAAIFFKYPKTLPSQINT